MVYTKPRDVAHLAARVAARLVVRAATPVVAPAVNRVVTRRAIGRGLGKPTTRARFLAGLQGKDVLEVGPFDNPVVRGERVQYFDVLDQKGLQARATVHQRDPAGVPVIHYVSPIGDLSVIDRPFDAVVSSHAIEHQPDLVAHLKAVADLLVRGGRYYVIAPDKRYCFDHFIPLSTTADVLRAHQAARKVHTREAILAHRLETTHNNALFHWLGFHGQPTPDVAARASAEQEAAAAEHGAYIDVHAWIFSPSRFRQIVTELAAAGHTRLHVLEVSDTAFPDLEFFAVLERRD